MADITRSLVKRQNCEEGGNLHPRRPPCDYLGEYTSRRKSKIPTVDYAYEKKKKIVGSRGFHWQAGQGL